MRNVYLSLIMTLCCVTAYAADALYACGGFNSWDILNCRQFTRADDGTFSIEIDFSQSNQLKISTTGPGNNTDTSKAWANFDTGSLNPVSTPKLNIIVGLQAGEKNITAPAQQRLTVKVDLDAMTILFSDGSQPSTAWSGTLPVMFINTDGGVAITSKEEYVTATYYLDPMDCEGVEAFGSAAEPLPLQIRGRGNYTWTGFDKKPYRIKLDKKAALLGMDKSKHFALLAHADDNRGFLRNTVGFRLSEMIGMAWTPKQQPVEVVLNGDYIGLYFLTETIRVDKNRVNIVEQPDYCTNADSITGGWLVEIDNYQDDPHVTVAEGGGNSYNITFTYKTPEALSSQQEQYLYNQMSTLNTLIYGSTSSDELWKHVNLDQLARYYIVQEVMDNYESFHGSCYFYKQMGASEKWTWGPVWDFGSAFFFNKDQYCWEGRPHHQVWIKGICQHPTFMDYVKDVWHEFNADSLITIYQYINDFAERIAVAAQYDYRRWPQYGNSDEMAAADRVREYVSCAQSWLVDKWGSGNPAMKTWTVTFYDETADPWSQAYAYVYDSNADGYDGTYMPLGAWSGRLMPTETIVNDCPGWTLKFTPDFALSADAKIIFNNGGSGDGNQTHSVELVDGGLYNRQGLVSEEVCALATSTMQIYAVGTTLFIKSDKATEVVCATVDGRTRILRVDPGTNVYTLPAGFYIVASKKIIIR